MNGFNVIISHVDAWYLDCGFGSWRSTGEGACSPYTTWQRVYKHRPWDRMHLDPIKMKQVCLYNQRQTIKWKSLMDLYLFRYLVVKLAYGLNK